VKGRDRYNEGIKEELNIYFTECFKENFSVLYTQSQDLIGVF
jgi:hypothetical protein